MTSAPSSSPTVPLPHLSAPGCVEASQRGAVLIATISRPEKRNALNDPTIFALEKIASNVPSDVRAILLTGKGDNFSAGLDLSELSERDVPQGVRHSMSWHRALERLQFGDVPVVAVLQGAVIGGGLELALASHVRVAEANAYYALPEGQRGIYVGGGASVRLPRVIGIDRMADMMLTGRTYSATEGLQLGLSQYVVDNGKGFEKGLELAEKISNNATITNFAVIHALPKIAEHDRGGGFLMEALMAGIAQGEPDAKERVRAFLEKRAAKVQHKA
ncbi:MAG: crotonase/enoyl-CoA hydratase family protein [Hyphomicrobiaceae bacterium]|nr:crotonase/enoyl-CoA hydratase family protein [Hyphomicrobiaceae bacterium]